MNGVIVLVNPSDGRGGSSVALMFEEVGSWLPLYRPTFPKMLGKLGLRQRLGIQNAHRDFLQARRKSVDMKTTLTDGSTSILTHQKNSRLAMTAEAIPAFDELGPTVMELY